MSNAHLLPRTISFKDDLLLNFPEFVVFHKTFLFLLCLMLPFIFGFFRGGGFSTHRGYQPSRLQVVSKALSPQGFIVRMRNPSSAMVVPQLLKLHGQRRNKNMALWWRTWFGGERPDLVADNC